MRAALLLGAFAAGVLVGCSQPTPQTNVQGFCRDFANHDPEVKRIREIGAGQPNYAADHQLELEQKLHTAEQKCLIAHGAAPLGGVQPSQNQWYQGGPFRWLF
jgi:hypothetical protein